MSTNWYPGHMKKATNNIQKLIKVIDFAIVLIDARAPFASINRDIFGILEGKPVLIIINKIDLCDLAETKKWLDYYTRTYVRAFLIDCRLKIRDDIVKLLRQITKEKRKKSLSKGIKNPIFKGVVLGVPNVGKSTFINALIGKKQLQAQNKPGVTKNINTVRINNEFYLLDTPGILEPKYEDPTNFYKLGIIGSVKEDVLPLETVNKYIFSFLIRYYRQNLSEYYDNIRITNDLTYSRFIAYVAKYHVSKLKNDELNIPEAEKKFFRDFKDAKIVKYTLDRIE